ncbi:hypothetical protein NEFER03_1029 [Nematocida sp. LUAm3]|nr:hypothetical protein NEFER03_1029 [Nematocida sp. LUAm3]KAI5175367.1 hypothetical protein NEFER02_1296 [Nematocida sp. LUAm2]KAI5177676.1 hypothetical protein NEFER01_0900 [Nematocida sp. LUAm1]
MDQEEKGAHLPNEILCATIGKIYSRETGDASSSHISYVIKRTNLSTPVVLGALYLAVSAREKAAQYVGKLREEIEVHHLRKEYLSKKIELCLKLCGNASTLFYISLIISSKYMVDRAYGNKTWSNVLMMDRKQINDYERVLLHIFDHQIEITEQTIRTVLEKVQNSRAPPLKKEGKLAQTLRRIVSCLFPKK